MPRRDRGVQPRKVGRAVQDGQRVIEPRPTGSRREGPLRPRQPQRQSVHRVGLEPLPRCAVLPFAVQPEDARVGRARARRRRRVGFGVGHAQRREG
eukprot:4495631-Prymnesium_polylepis.1